MALSPRRFAVFLDEPSWPLEDVATPDLVFSTSFSTECIDNLMPPTPKMEDPNHEPFLLPGFHFSTDNDAVDAAEFHRMAAQLLSGEAKADVEGEDEEVPRASKTPGHLHCNLGQDPSGRHCCSCGKSYSTAARLSEHMQRCAGIKNYPCHTCDKVHVTQEALRRHIALKHNGDVEPCPECGVKFPSTYLPKHLASGLGGCDGTVQGAVKPPLNGEFAAEASPSQRYWSIEGDHTWKKKGARDSGYVSNESEEVTSQTMSVVTRLLQRAGSSPDAVSCDLCGEDFPSQSGALAKHIGQHSIDFSEKRHRCDDCRIFFANEKDLNRHLQSANLTQHCGFTFRHNAPCTGHHPPTFSKASIANDHALMQKHLWSWELSQFRTHRVAVATILARTLNGSAAPHMSLSDCQRTYSSLLPHFAAANPNRHSSQSGSSGDGRDSIDAASLHAHFRRVIDDIDAQRAATAAQLNSTNNSEQSDRPDSGVILQATRISFHRHRRGAFQVPGSSKKGSSSRSNPATAAGASTPTASTKDDPHRAVSFRKSIFEKTLRRTVLLAEHENNTSSSGSSSAETSGPKGHKRNAFSASGFALLRQRPDTPGRPSSAPDHNMAVAVATC